MSESFDYIESRTDADELITEFGQAVVLKRMVKSGTAAEPTLTPVPYNTHAVILDYTNQQVDGQNIFATDRRALVAAGPLVAAGVTSIAEPDVLVVDGEEIPIQRVVPLNPGGVLVMFDCQLRL